MKAQIIIKQFRANLHDLYSTVTEKREDTAKRVQADRVLAYIRQHSTVGITARDVYRALRLDTETALKQIDALLRVGLMVTRRVGAEKTGRHHYIK